MQTIKKYLPGMAVCLAIAVPSWLLGKLVPVIGGPVFSIVIGMVIALFWTPGAVCKPGVGFTSKKILQTAVVLLGFGLNLNVVLETGKQSLPIIVCTIAASLLGQAIGFDTTSGESFGIFAGTAVNDTSSVTAAASTWDSMWELGSQTLDKAVTVKLTRTLAIIPITLVLSLMQAKKAGTGQGGFRLKNAFPMFILWFVCASVVTTICTSLGVPSAVFQPLKELSKFFIIMAMAAIGLNSNVVKLVKSGGKPLLLGACCWAGITAVSLLMQRVMGLW